MASRRADGCDMGERKRESATQPKLRRQHHSVDNVSQEQRPASEVRARAAPPSLERDQTGKPNRFGWKSWSQHRLSDLSSAKRAFGRFKDSGECVPPRPGLY